MNTPTGSRCASAREAGRAPELARVLGGDAGNQATWYGLRDQAGSR